MTDAPASPSPAGTRKRHHTEMLVVSLLVVAASFLLSVGEGGGVRVASSTRLKLPPLCVSKSLFGVECPGCGLTRAFVHLAHGNVHDSLAVNRVGWYVALALLVQIPYRVLALCRHQALPLGVWTPRLFGLSVIIALIGSWLLKQFGI